MEVFHQDPVVGVSAKYFRKKESDLEICTLKHLTRVPLASRASFYTHKSYGSISSDIEVPEVAPLLMTNLWICLGQNQHFRDNENNIVLITRVLSYSETTSAEH